MGYEFLMPQKYNGEGCVGEKDGNLFVFLWIKLNIPLDKRE